MCCAARIRRVCDFRTRREIIVTSHTGRAAPTWQHLVRDFLPIESRCVGDSLLGSRLSSATHSIAYAFTYAYNIHREVGDAPSFDRRATSRWRNLSSSWRPLLALLAGTGLGFVKMAEKSGSPAAETAQEQQPQQFLSNFIAEIVKSPVNLALVGLIAILVYKIVKSRTKTEEPVQEVKKLPKLRRDFAIEELTKYDGKGPDGRILVAVNGSVYDVTRGSKFYGPGEFEATYR